MGKIMVEKDVADSEEIFEAVSHPQRIKILRVLAKSSLGFSELKRAVSIESSGALDFHLNKMEGLLTKDSHGHYSLNKNGYAALEAVNAIERYGWYKRAFYFNIIAFTLIILWAYLNFALSTSFLAVLILSVAWIMLYSYWTLVHRRAFIRGKEK
ncbi:helix-turn-helix domain-containing protein [Candidatus Bathyarchaeota archaeon]|nr:helix-turn-helix domain-containing protein [Candidatus Bathyarchaeota archaeon]